MSMLQSREYEAELKNRSVIVSYPATRYYLAMIKRIAVNTDQREQMVDITAQVEEAIRDAAISEGTCTVYSPHTTAAITINEGHDPAVVSDMLHFLRELVPQSSAFRHYEGNSDAHIKVSLVGPEVSIPVDNGAPMLGTWQRIFFCEFDGPRNRTAVIQVR